MQHLWVINLPSDHPIWRNLILFPHVHNILRVSSSKSHYHNIATKNGQFTTMQSSLHRHWFVEFEVAMVFEKKDETVHIGALLHMYCAIMDIRLKCSFLEQTLRVWVMICHSSWISAVHWHNYLHWLAVCSWVEAATNFHLPGLQTHKCLIAYRKLCTLTSCAGRMYVWELTIVVWLQVMNARIGLKWTSLAGDERATSTGYLE